MNRNRQVDDAIFKLKLYNKILSRQAKKAEKAAKESFEKSKKFAGMYEKSKKEKYKQLSDMYSKKCAEKEARAEALLDLSLEMEATVDRFESQTIVTSISASLGNLARAVDVTSNELDIRKATTIMNMLKEQSKELDQREAQLTSTLSSMSKVDEQAKAISAEASSAANHDIKDMLDESSTVAVPKINEEDSNKDKEEQSSNEENELLKRFQALRQIS